MKKIITAILLLTVFVGYNNGTGEPENNKNQISNKNFLKRKNLRGGGI